MSPLLLILLVCLPHLQADTNYLHYGFQGMRYVGTNYRWGLIEPPHRVRWHHDYYGPELVRLELRTNVVQLILCSDPVNGFHRVMSQRRVLWVASAGPTNTTLTNELILLELNRYREWPVVDTNCCTMWSTNRGGAQ